MISKHFASGVFVLTVVGLMGCAAPSTKLQNSSGQVVDCSTMGLGIIGTAAALSMHSNCVSKAEASGFHEVNANSVAPKPSADTSKINIELSAEWERKPLTEAMAAGGGSVYATNKGLDAGVLVSVAKREGVADLMAYVFSRRSKAESILLNGQSTDIAIKDVNGRQTFRYEVSGFIKGGMKITYLQTIIVGADNLIMVNTWTKAADYVARKPMLEPLATKVTGIS